MRGTIKTVCFERMKNGKRNLFSAHLKSNMNSQETNFAILGLLSLRGERRWKLGGDSGNAMGIYKALGRDFIHFVIACQCSIHLPRICHSGICTCRSSVIGFANIFSNINISSILMFLLFIK